QRLKDLEEVVQTGELPAKAEEAIKRGRCWMAELVVALGWFWSVAQAKMEALDLSEETQRVVEEKLLGGLYWEQAGRRGRSVEERQERKGLAERLLAEAWEKEGGLGGLAEEKRKEIERVGREIVGLFARSSSCVEGRNGRLSLFHHGQTRI